ncbi:hypothetical protein, partial [Klebsiella pneumoniae]|uniref:hypothetical protein n=1 Tax=Klebsiella pneumoniae TaxID=573 RepID=UPI00259FF32B
MRPRQAADKHRRRAGAPAAEHIGVSPQVGEEEVEDGVRFSVAPGGSQQQPRRPLVVRCSGSAPYG